LVQKCDQLHFIFFSGEDKNVSLVFSIACTIQVFDAKRGKATFYVLLGSGQKIFEIFSIAYRPIINLFIYLHCLNTHADLAVFYTITSRYSFNYFDNFNNKQCYLGILGHPLLAAKHLAV
jgi:hypothetical protein